MPTLVKICGVTRVEDAVAAARFGADFIGLNFYPGSPRCIDETQARLIVGGLPPSVMSVALFVNEHWNRIRELTGRCEINIAQVHGEPISPCPFTELRWIPAFGLQDESCFAPESRVRSDHAYAPIKEFSRSLDASPFRWNRPEAVLIDAHVPGMHGGTGKALPWVLVPGAAIAACFTPMSRLILAGGLTPDNVAEAIRIVRPWAVDVASGVESAPGIKDHDKMRRFIEAAKSV
jgi:phosphoribosylanthranilate isomerase